MADIAPLQPLHYDPTLLPQVVAPPYDVINESMRAALGAKHKYNVVHLDLPIGDGDAKYQNARQLFEAWQKDGVLRRDSVPAFWRYAQTFAPPGGGELITRKGFLALVRATPFSDRIVLPHERTLKGPKVDRIMLSRATRATLSPQFMLYSDPGRELDAALDTGLPFADFNTDDGVRQRLWRVTNADAIRQIRQFMSARTLLIADGHHRYETSVAISDEFEAEAKARGLGNNPNTEHRFTYAFLANGDDPSLVVFPTHRLVHSLRAFDWVGFCAHLEAWFTIERYDGHVDELRQRLVTAGALALAAIAQNGAAALLLPKSDVDWATHPILGRRPQALQCTSVAILHDVVLEGALGISAEAQAAKTNIKYLQEPQSGVALLQGGEGQVLFLMNGTPLASVRAVAEAGEVMPQEIDLLLSKGNYWTLLSYLTL